MSILGAVVRVRRESLPLIESRLAPLPGVDIAVNPGDGRLVLVMEDTADASNSGNVTSAAATLTAISSWPDVLSTSLVYEYSGPDAPPLVTDDMSDFRAWRGNPAGASGVTNTFIEKPAQPANNTENIV